MARSDLEAEFNQISVVNILVHPYSCILAFVLCTPVVDQSCSALSVNTGLSGLHLAVSGCWCFPFKAAALGAHLGLVGSSNFRAKGRTASAPLYHSMHKKHTHSLPTAARNTQRNMFPFKLVNPSAKRTFQHPVTLQHSTQTYESVETSAECLQKVIVGELFLSSI